MNKENQASFPDFTKFPEPPSVEHCDSAARRRQKLPDEHPEITKEQIALAAPDPVWLEKVLEFGGCFSRLRRPQ